MRSTTWLRDKGIETPRLDAELLMAHVLGCERLQLFLTPDRPLNEDELQPYRELLQRRSEHEPIAYMVGDVGFWDYTFKIDARALIPRPETEGIVRQVLEAAGDKRDQPLRIVDVGTGSGILAVTLALIFPQAQVVAIDTSTDALSLCKENAALHNVDDRVHCIAGDLLTPLIKKGSKSDIIVSNPPYVGEREREMMSAGVEKWEPHQALFAGVDGFEVIDRLLKQIPQTLADGGLFVMEFGSPQGDGIKTRAQRMFRDWQVVKDYNRHDRLLVVNGPGSRTWHVSTAENPNSQDPSTEPSLAAEHEHEMEDTWEPATSPMLYGGEDGTERLPEIDLHADMED